MAKPLYQSGAIPFRVHGGIVEVALITSRKRKRWIIPKGIIEPNLKASESALKEVFEEAGLMGEITGPSVGEYREQKWYGTLKIKVYPMQVNRILQSWPEKDFRTRKWFSIKDAAKKVENKELADLLKKFRKVTTGAIASTKSIR